MDLPSIAVTVRNGGLRRTAPSPSGASIKIGCAGGGSESTPSPCNSLSAVDTGFGVSGAAAVGPLAECLRYHLRSALGGIGVGSTWGLTVPATVEQDADDVTPTVTRVGSSTGTIALDGIVAADALLQLLATRSGAAGAAAVRASYDGGQSFGPEVFFPTNGVITLSQVSDPSTPVTATLTGSIEAGDLFTATLVGPTWALADITTALAAAVTAGIAAKVECVHVVGPAVPKMSSVTHTQGSGPNTVTLTAPTPADYYDLVIEITTGGAAGTAVFKWSVDGGATFTTGAATTGGTAVLGATGITANFGAGTFVAGGTPDKYIAHGAQGVRDLADSMKTTMASWQTAGRYVYAQLDAPMGASKAILRRAMAGFVSNQVVIGAGVMTAIELDQRPLRSPAWAVAARAAMVPLHEDLSRVKSGGVNEVAAFSDYSDLAADRFAVLYQIEGNDGVFINGSTFEASNGDVDSIHYRRVLDEGARTLRASLIQEIGDDHRTNAADGTLYAADADAIDAALQSAQVAALLSRNATNGPHASAVSAKVDRTVDFQTTKTLVATVDIVPRPSVRRINASIGLTITVSRAAA